MINKVNKSTIKVNLAILSPSQNAYSETFIQAHKNIPGTKVSYYFGGLLPHTLEGAGGIFPQGRIDRIIYAIKKKLWRNDWTYEEAVLSRSFKKKQIQCVLAEFGPIGAAVLPVCERLNLPLIVHFHGYDASVSEILKQYADGYQRMFAYASSIVAVSKAMQQRLVEIGCPPEKIVYNPYGPNDLFFENTPEYTGKKFIGIGRFVDKKAPYYTILAFHQVLQRHPDARLVIGGDGPLQNTCKNLIAYLGMQAQVQLPGVLTPDEYRAHLKDSIAFVQHSITAANGDMEGTPVAVLEASAAGLPVISTRHAGIPDVILHQQTGLLVEEHDVDGMAHWMNWVLENPVESRKIGEQGKRRIWEHFSLKLHLSSLNQMVVNSSRGIVLPPCPTPRSPVPF